MSNQSYMEKYKLPIKTVDFDAETVEYLNGTIKSFANNQKLYAETIEQLVAQNKAIESGEIVCWSKFD